MNTKNLNISILVIDDDPFMLHTTSVMLENMGFCNILTANSAVQAKRAIKKSDRPVSLILSDLNMPEVDGVELLRHFDEMKYTGDIVFISGEDPQTLHMTETLAKARGLSVIGSISKPARSDLLLEILARHTAPSCPTIKHRELPHVTPVMLNRAIVNGELEPWFQPKINIKSKEAVGVEALARWQNCTNGPVFPDQFIPLAEANELIDPLTFLMLDQSIAMSQQWRSQGLNLTIAINASMNSLYASNFPDRLYEKLIAAGGNSNWLQLEVTESCLMEDLVAPLETLLRLRLKKIKLSIDDFGTGHSNITQLRDLPFDELKLDRSYVHSAMSSERARKILESSIAMAKNLNMTIVAEGVETLEEWHLVEQLGCDIVQGYWVAKPMHGRDIPDWVNSWRKRREELFDTRE